jgi:hypothetical protein
LVGVGAVGVVRAFGGAFIGVLVATSAAFGQCVLPNNLLNGTVADAPQMMANFNALVACLTPGGSTNAIQYNGGSGVLGSVGPLADGELLVGSAGNPPQVQALTAGSNVAITNGAGSVSIAATNAASNTGLYRQVLSATPTIASTGLGGAVNLGTAIVGDSPTGMFIDAPPSGTTVANLAGRYGTAPTPPYSIKVLIAATRSSNNYSAVGIGWYDGASKIHVMDIATASGGANFVEVTQWNSPTSFNATPYASPVNAFAQPIWMQIADDGTNVSFAFSQDGANFLPISTVAKASGFLGASGYSNVFFFVNPRGTSRTIGTLLSWTQN